MKIGDVAITPQITFLDTKANVEAFPDPQEGMEAISSDTHEKGFYNGSAWVWGGGGGTTDSLRFDQVLHKETDNLISNSTFDTGDVWDLGAGWSIAGGKLVATATSAIAQFYPLKIICGLVYRITFDVVVTSGSVHMNFSQVDDIEISTTQTRSVDLAGLYPSSNNLLDWGWIYFYGTGFTGTIDNVSVTIVEETDLTELLNLKITDAPSDNNFYGRRNAFWVNLKTYFDTVYQAIGSYLTDAPADGSYYGRLNAAWTNLKTYFDTLYAPLSHGSHIPAAGVITQFLQWASSGVAKWVTASGDATIADGGEITVNKTRLNVRNETGVTIASTRAVYVSGFNNLPLILLADNTNEAKHNVIGLTIAPIAHEANGKIATSGQCDAETNAWVVGTELYLSTAGTLTPTEPTSGSVQHVGVVTVKENYPTGKILLYMQPEGNVMAVGAGQDAIIRLGDSVGATGVSVKDYANTEVARIDSDGHASVAAATALAHAVRADQVQTQSVTAYTTAGTTTAFTLTTLGTPIALTTNERWRVKFNATAGASPTLNRDSKGAKALKYYDATGAKVTCGATTIIANMLADVEYDGVDYVVLMMPTAYAPVAKGVTNGDTHDHAGGDGAQIAYGGLSGLPTITNPPTTTAAWDVQVGDGSGNWIKKTWAEFLANFPIAIGTWTPTLTNVTNLSASTVSAAGLYVRILSIVIGSVSLTADPTAAGNWILGFTVPVASAFTTTYDLNGNATAVGTSFQSAGSVLSDATNDRGELTSYSADGANRFWRVLFMYIIK